MGHERSDKGHGNQIQNFAANTKHHANDDFVLEKSIFNNIFEKDIRRVFIYKKAERLAKALHLIAPAFSESVSLRNRIDAIAIGLIDAAVLPPGIARTALSRELLSLSSVLGIARTGGLLSVMNAELIAREAQILLQEVAVYEEPRLFLDDAPTLSGIAKSALKKESVSNASSATIKNPAPRPAATPAASAKYKGHIKDTIAAPSGAVKDRREAVMSVIRNKGSVSIKDISTLIRGVSEKTIQRELTALIESGLIAKQGERRWSTYSLR
ncbi:MAG: DeoR family transcriptional regulator [Candidatus Paceibacteria bacterium]